MCSIKNSMCLFLRCLGCLCVYYALRRRQINVSSKTPLLDTFFTRHLLNDFTRHRYLLDTFVFTEGVLHKKPESHYPCGFQDSLDTKTPKTPIFQPYWKSESLISLVSGEIR